MTRPPTFVEDLFQSDAIIEDFDDYLDRWHALSDNEEAPDFHDYLRISFSCRYARGGKRLVDDGGGCI